MALVGVSLTSFIMSTLLYHSLADSTCMPMDCLNCTLPNSGNCSLCSSNSTSNTSNTSNTSVCDDSKNCPIRNFTVKLNASSFTVDDGTTLNVTCVNDLPQTLSFDWSRDGQLIPGENTSVLVTKIKEQVTLACTVRSPCGNFSSAAQTVTVNDQTGIVLLICGVSAVVIIILLAITMKVLIKRNEAQREARKRQRQANLQNISGTTTTGYW